LIFIAVVKTAKQFLVGHYQLIFPDVSQNIWYLLRLPQCICSSVYETFRNLCFKYLSLFFILETNYTPISFVHKWKARGKFKKS